MSSRQRSNYVGTVQANIINGLKYFVNGAPLAASNLVNDLGFVTAADSPHADWGETNANLSSFIVNKPVLAPVATSGSASDLTTGTLPVNAVPYLDCDQIASGVFPITRMPVIPAGLVSGLSPIATSGNLWTGANVAVLNANTPTPLGAGGFVGWNRDGASGLTAFTNNKGAFSPGGWEWVSYKSDQSLELVSASLSSQGVLNVAGGLAVNGAPLAAVATSGSASDITTGTLPQSVLPPIPASSVSYGSFQSDLVPSSPNQYNIGSSSEPWATVWGQAVYVNGQKVQAVATSASASDLNSGTLPVARLPSIPASQIGAGVFGSGSFGCDVVPGSASAYSLGSATIPWKNLVMTGSLQVGSRTLQPVGLSGSASDLTAGTLPVAQVPQLPASQLTSGVFSVGSFGCSVVPAATNLSLGSGASRWTNVVFTHANFGGIISGGGRTDRCQIALAGSSLLPGSTAYIGFGVGTNGAATPGALEAHVDQASSDFVWYCNTSELLRLKGSGRVLPGSPSAQSFGYFGSQWQHVFAKQLWQNELPLQTVCTSGSASDIQTGTLPLAQVPALPPNQLSLPGTVSIDLIPATANSLRVGSAGSPWGSVFAQQIYRNGVALAAVATSGAWSDMQQPVAVQGTPALSVNGPGFYFAYGRVPGSGRTSLVSQRGAGTTGGFELLSYNASNGAEGGLTVDSRGNTGITGALSGLGAGGLLMRSWDESAPSTAGSRTHRFQGRPVECVLAPTVNLANFAVGPAGQTTQFASRLTGYMQPPYADSYTFKVTYEDAVRVWVNNLLVVDSWTTSTSATTQTFVTPLGTKVVPVMIEYFQTTGTSALQVQWKGASNNTAFQPLTHGDYTGGTAFSLYYDLYENPPSQLGTTWVNGPLYANSITNNGSGVSIADKVDLGGNALYGVSFVNNKGSPIAVGDALAVAGKPVYGVSSLGVGTSAPAVALDVFGASNAGQVHITASDLNEASIGFGNSTNNGTFNPSNCWVMGRGSWGSGTNMGIGMQGTGGVLYVTGGSSPSVGINQATPQYNLDVTGTARFTGTVYAPQIVTNSVTTNASNNSFGNTLFITQGTGVSILKSSAACALDVAGDAAVSGKAAAGSVLTPQLNPDKSALAIGTSMYFTGGSTPMVGVNQSSPSYALDVAGSIQGTGRVIAGELATAAINSTTPQTLTVNGFLTCKAGSTPMLGVGQAAPNATLDVAGSIRASTRVNTANLYTSAVNPDSSAVSICGFATLLYGGSGGAVPMLALNQSSPAYNLDVGGTGRFSQALVASASLTTPAVNPGGSACTIANSLYCTGGGVPKFGLNTASPAATCDVTGTLKVSGGSTLGGDLAVPSINLAGGALSLGNFVFFKGGSNPALGIVQTSPNYTLDITGNCNVTGPLYAYSVSTATVTCPGASLSLGGTITVQPGSTPKVGVNNTAPAASLDVTGTGRFSSGLAAGSVTTASVSPPGSTLTLGNALVVATDSNNITSVGLFTNSPGATFDCRGTGNFSSSVTTVDVETASINSTGNALKLGSLVTLTAGSPQQLGIGTTTPGATLDVVGSFRTSGSMTVPSIQTPTINGDGSTIHIGNAIHYIGGSTPMVGIMQASPQFTLDVSGNARFTSSLAAAGVVTGSIGNGGSGLRITETATINAVTTPTINASGGALAMGGTLTVSGNRVGIMQTSPGFALDCTGAANFTGNVAAGSLSTPTINAGNFPLAVGSQLTLTGSKVGVFNTNPAATLDLVGSLACSGAASTGSLVTPVLNGDGSAVTISKSLTCTGGTSPKVGILTSQPGAELDVRGNVSISQACTAGFVKTAQINQDNSPLVVGSTMWFTGGSTPSVGILQQNPQFTLDVAGNAQVTGGIVTGAVTAKGSTLPVGGVLTCVPGTPALGVNTSSPGATLDVNGSANISGQTALGGLKTSTINAGGDALVVGVAATPGISFQGGSTPKIGIAQASPAYTLDVSGTAQITTGAITPQINGSGQALTLAKTLWCTGQANSNSVAPMLGVCKSNPSSTLDVVGNAAVSQYLQSTGVYTPWISTTALGGTNHVFDITATGVGLFQASPQFSLDITGNLQATSGVNTPVVTGPNDSVRVGSNVYMKGGRLGVFQSNPGTGGVPGTMPSGTTLDVAGIVRTLGTTGELMFVQSQTGGSGNSAYLAMGDAISTNNSAFLQFNNVGGSGSASNTVSLGIWPTPGLTLTPSGVGVFNNAPGMPLDVAGNANVAGTIYGAALQATKIKGTQGATLSIMPNNADTTQAVTVGGTESSPIISAANGMMGVGTTAPGYTLDVNGTARATASVVTAAVSTGTIGNNGSGVTFGSDAVTVQKLVLPKAPSFTGDVNELANAASLAGAAMPIGSMIQWGANSMAGLPSYFFECLGQTVSRSNYSSLFQIIGTTYGTGDGSTTFTLPNLQGRVVCGYVPSNGDSNFPESGFVSGEQYHKLSVAEMPGHSHGVNDPGHKHLMQAATRGYATVGTGVSVGVTAIGDAYNQQSGNSQPQSTGVSLQSTGGTAAHNNLQPYIVMRYLIKWGPNVPLPPVTAIVNGTTSSGAAYTLTLRGASGQYVDPTITWQSFDTSGGNGMLVTYTVNGASQSTFYSSGTNNFSAYSGAHTTAWTQVQSYY